jgi:hypothetical protein
MMMMMSMSMRASVVVCNEISASLVAEILYCWERQEMPALAGAED